MLLLSGCFTRTTLSGFPTSIGPGTIVFRLPTGTPNVRRQYRLYLLLPKSYRIRLGDAGQSACAIYAPNGSSILVTATWIDAGGSRHPLDDVDCAVNGSLRKWGFSAGFMLTLRRNLQQLQLQSPPSLT